MRIVSLSVGIVQYRERYYRENEFRLRFATQDARALHAYSSTASDLRGKDYHKLIVDDDARLEVLEACCDELGQLEKIDLFICYLSGHGECFKRDGGWFCLVDAKRGIPSLDGSTLNLLLGKVKAKSTLCVLDCCFAESIVADATFFAGLDGASSRIIIASARRDQRAWEDHTLQRSILSDVLLRGLSEGSGLADALGQVSVSASLVPYIVLQVPLLAAALKEGAVQEPVVGGISAANLSLPTVTSKSFGRPMTVSETVRTQLKRWGLVLLMCLVIGLVVVDMSFYYLSVRSNGAIDVRSGFSFTHALTPFHSGRDVDTGFLVSDLDQRKDEFFARLDGGTIWGASTRRDPQNLKTWLLQLEPGLAARTKSTIRVLAYGTAATFPDDALPPIVEAAFLSRLLDEPVASIAGRVYGPHALDPPQCDQSLVRNEDLSTSNIPTPVFERDLQWLALRGASVGSRASDTALSMLRAIAYRAAKGRAEDELRGELDTFARQLIYIVERNPKTRDSIYAVAQTMIGTWCRIPALLTMAISGEGKVREAVEAKLMDKFLATLPSDPTGNSLDSQRYGAVLTLLATYRQLGQTEVGRISEAIVRTPSVLSADSPGHELLNAVALNYSLPSSMKQWLLSRLNLSIEDDVGPPITAFQILARNAPMLSSVERATLRQWVLEKGPDLHIYSAFRESLGYAFSSCDDGIVLSWLASDITPASRFPVPAVGYRGELVVSPSSDVAIVSLGRWAQRCALPKELTDRLENVASWRATLASRDEVLKGLAHQWLVLGETPMDALLSALDKTSGDAAERRVAIDASAAYISALPTREGNRALGYLVAVWKQEDAPERKIAIGRIIGEAISGDLTGVTTIN